MIKRIDNWYIYNLFKKCQPENNYWNNAAFFFLRHFLTCAFTKNCRNPAKLEPKDWRKQVFLQFCGRGARGRRWRRRSWRRRSRGCRRRRRSRQRRRDRRRGRRTRDGRRRRRRRHSSLYGQYTEREQKPFPAARVLKCHFRQHEFWNAISGITSFEMPFPATRVLKLSSLSISRIFESAKETYIYNNMHLYIYI